MYALCVLYGFLVSENTTDHTINVASVHHVLHSMNTVTVTSGWLGQGAVLRDWIDQIKPRDHGFSN